MFFQGSLQEGIATALQQSKSVVCFVTDSCDESQQWENEFLTDGNVDTLIDAQAVLLRLEAGSQEEGFLTQLYPIPKKPTVVIIKNGELKEYIAAGVSKGEFIRRVQGVLQQPSVPPAPAAAPVPQTLATSSSPQPTPTAATTTDPAAESSSGQTTLPSTSESSVQSILAERAARLAAQEKHRKEEAAKQRSAEKSSSSPSVGTDPSSKAKHSDELKKRQKEAREERQRILKAIEDDKAARRARQAEREAEREAERQAAASAGGGSSDDANKSKTSLPFAPENQLLPSAGRLSEHCAIQVRLLDGSTIRSRFSSATDTIKQVREWVDGARTDGNTPYSFKILLTPLPSRAIEADDETKSLQALRLAPSSTLIMLPAGGKKYMRPRPAPAAAVAANGGEQGAGGGEQVEEEGTIFERFIAFILGIISGLFTGITMFFSTLFSVAGPPAEGSADEPDNRQSPQQRQAGSSSTTTGRDSNPGSGSTSSRIKGLERRRTEERKNDQQQFYNGNSTNFEPRRDDDDE